MKTSLALLMCLSLVACASGYNPRYYYGNIEVANLSGAEIRDVEVQVGAEGRRLSCASVNKNALCQERFGKRPYPQDGIRLSWIDGSGEPQTQQLNPSIPLTLVPSLALRVMLDINADGSVKAYFLQDNRKLGD